MTDLIPYADYTILPEEIIAIIMGYWRPESQLVYITQLKTYQRVLKCEDWSIMTRWEVRPVIRGGLDTYYSCMYSMHHKFAVYINALIEKSGEEYISYPDSRKINVRYAHAYEGLPERVKARVRELGDVAAEMYVARNNAIVAWRKSQHEDTALILKNKKDYLGVEYGY